MSKRVSEWVSGRFAFGNKSTLLLLRVVCDIPPTRMNVSLSNCCSLLNTSSCQKPSRMKQTERERALQILVTELWKRVTWKRWKPNTWCYSLLSGKFPSKFSAVGTKYAQETPRSNAREPLKMTILKFRLHQRKTERASNTFFHISFLYDTQNNPSGWLHCNEYYFHYNISFIKYQ